MKFTLSWLKDHLDTDASVDEIAEAITLEQGKKCSMHFHKEKEEIFFVVSGAMVFKYIDPETGRKECE